METLIEKFKGIHPGAILERELKKRNLKKGPFAISLQQYPQVINEITKKRRGIPPSLALKIDRALGLEEGTMYLLQAYYETKLEIDKEKDKDSEKPNLPLLRNALFWDTDITKIDWKRQYKAVIQRIFERGNDVEKTEMLRFYGKEKIKEITGKSVIKGNSLEITLVSKRAWANPT
jgi:plasmid maintenance system antidote protein VapI